MTDGTPARRAAIDIGTVSTRLLVADVSDGRVDELVRHTVVTHLGEGVAATGRLLPEAVERTLATVAGYQDEAHRLGATAVECVATSAARDAGDGAGFLERLRGLGLSPTIVSGPREAYLSFRGATYSLRDDDVLVADLGGGSTELIFGSVAENDGAVEVDAETSRSIDVGSRRVTDMFLTSDPPSADEMEDAASWVVEQVRPFFDGLKRKPRSMVALAGTATTLSAVHQGLVEYDAASVHDSILSGGDLAELKGALSRLTLEERRRVDGLDPARADVIVGGVLVLEALLGLAGLDAMTVSEHDILYGLVLEGA